MINELKIILKKYSDLSIKISLHENYTRISVGTNVLDFYESGNVIGAWDLDEVVRLNVMDWFEKQKEERNEVIKQ